MIKDTAVHLGKFPRGVLQISSDRDDWRILGGGLKCYFSISGFFWVGKFWQVFFQVAWFKWEFFWVFKTNVSVFRVISFNAIWKSLWLGNSAWDFLGFQVLPTFNHPCHLKSGVPFPPPPTLGENWREPSVLNQWNLKKITLSNQDFLVARKKNN